MTPHIACEKDQIANIVLTAGDPKRVELIAQTFLTDPKLVSDVRGELFYTGEYKGKRITVMSSGMGIPSMGIYSYELFKFYDVDYIIRIGTAGSYVPDLDCYDLLLVTESYSESTYARVQNGSLEDVKQADPYLTDRIKATAMDLRKDLRVGKVHSKDVFYSETNNYSEMVSKHNVLAVEMESFALFHNALLFDKKAACLLTISDSLVTGATTSASDRSDKVMGMVEMVLETVVNL